MLSNGLKIQTLLACRWFLSAVSAVLAISAERCQADSYQVGDTAVVAKDAAVKIEYDVVDRVRNGDRVKVLAVKGKWIKTRGNRNNTGWVKVANLVTPETARILTKSAAGTGSKSETKTSAGRQLADLQLPQLPMLDDIPKVPSLPPKLVEYKPPAVKPQKESGYGAIAYSQSERCYGAAWGYPSQAEADAAALSYCQHSDAFIAVRGKNEWIALAHGYGTSWGAYHCSHSKQRAMDMAVQWCSKYAGGAHVLFACYSAGEGRATVKVKAPRGATVSIGSWQVKMQNGAGSFQSNKLLGGTRKSYTLDAKMTFNGVVVRDKAIAKIESGETTYVRFPKLEMAAKLGKPFEISTDAGVVPAVFYPGVGQ